MIGIFGGTFDPVHRGHLETVSHVRETLELELVRLVPLANAVHRNPPQASAEQRLKMLQTACQSDAHLVVDTIELDRSGASYTVDTLQQLKSGNPDHSLCLITGSDAFAGFPEWHQPERILSLANLVVMQRPNHPVDFSHPLYRQRTTENAANFKQSPNGSIIAINVPQLAVSSTLIRESIKQRKNLDLLLTEEVIELIKQWHLYET